jgi:polyferredoxin
MLVVGGAVLVLSTFIGRPYCRFLCPYGVLLGWLSRLSWSGVTITPDECVVCRLCEDACPFGAIEPANAVKEDEE